MSFSLLSKKEEVNLLLHIGNGNISGGLVKFKNGQKPTLIYSVCLDSDKSPNSLSSLLGEILASIMKKGLSAMPAHAGQPGGKIFSVLVSFSSPWFVSEAKNIHLVQNIPFVITNKFIGSILKSEGELFKKNLRLMENVILHSKINGYSVENIFGKTTSVATKIMLDVHQQGIGVAGT